MASRCGKNGNWQTFLGVSKIIADGGCSHEIKRRLRFGRKVMTNLDSLLKRKRHYFANKGPSSQSYGFSSSHTWMRELDYKESWTPKNWCFWTVVLEKTLESPLDSKEIKPVHLKGNQSWIFIRRIDAEAETPILWPLNMKNWLIGKDPDVGKDWGQEGKGTTEDKMVGWYHRHNWHGFGWTVGVGGGQGRLACHSPWGRKESDTTEWLNSTGPPVSGCYRYSMKPEKEMVTHSSILAWRIPRTEEPGRLQPWAPKELDTT